LGSDVNALNEYSGLSAIHKACRATEDSSVELITKILERGGNPNSKSGKQGTPPLFICAGSDNIKGMKTLLSLGADKSQISNLGYDVLLYSALYSESPSTLQFAKTLTLNRSVNDNEGNNAMHLLIANQAGAELLAENCDLLDLMELPNRNGITPFTELFSSSSWRVTMAVRESCDYDIRNKKFANGRNAFHEFFSDPSTTEIKFSPGSGLVIGIDIDQQDKDGNTPLLLALLNKRSSKHIERLLELGADISITNNLGQDFDSLIHEYGYEEILKLSSKIRSIEKSIRSAESLDEVFLIMENEPPYYKRMMQISEQATLLSRLLTRLERGEPSRFQVLKTGFTKFLERNGLKRTEISHADIQTEDAEYMVKLVFSHASINQDYQGVLKLLNHLAIAEGGSLGNLMDCSVARRELQRVFDAVSLDETRQKLRDIIDPRGDDWCGLNQTQ
jgi:hypothetical protein